MLDRRSRNGSPLGRVDTRDCAIDEEYRHLSTPRLPALRPEFEATRATLHAYAAAVGAIPRAHGIPHPNWWHISLKVRPEGLVTDLVPLPDGGAIAIAMDVKHHEIVVRSSGGAVRTIDLRDGRTGTEMGRALTSTVTEFGLPDTYDRDRFESDDARTYDPAAAAAYLDAFVEVTAILERHRVTLGDRVGPIQVWPHNFDLAFEWFGTRTEKHDGVALSSQLNLGFYPAGDQPYFYSNPWPFDETFVDTPLPEGAVWHMEGWQGTMLPYAVVQFDPDGIAKLAAYARAVFDATAPTLGVT
jgi:hypothetical protein